MEVNTVLDEPGNKKPSRKPRPSELATKKAKTAKKKTKAKPAKKAKAVKRPKPKTKKAKAKKGRVVPAGGIVRSERLDMRLSKAEKAKVVAKSKKTRCTVTSLVLEAIEKIK